MTIDTKKMLEALKSSSDNTVTMDKDFFIDIIEELDIITSGIKVEELFNTDKRYSVSDGNQTIINSGELLSEDGRYSNLTGEVLVEVKELKALLKENNRHRIQIKDLKNLSLSLEKRISAIYSNKRVEEDYKRLNNPYNNNLNENIKIDLRG